MWLFILVFFFFKQKTAYEMRISDWSSDVCSSDLGMSHAGEAGEDQHQACQERQKGSHEPALTTERFPCHCNNSRAGAFAARHAGQASPSTRHAERRKITAINPPTMIDRKSTRLNSSH